MRGVRARAIKMEADGRLRRRREFLSWRRQRGSATTRLSDIEGREGKRLKTKVTTWQSSRRRCGHSDMPWIHSRGKRGISHPSKTSLKPSADSYGQIMRRKGCLKWRVVPNGRLKTWPSITSASTKSRKWRRGRRKPLWAGLYLAYTIRKYADSVKCINMRKRQ